MSSDAVIKQVANKLRHYFEVKRLEDGFDLSNVHCPQLDHPPQKSGATLQYDGMHDRPLKHYFKSSDIKVGLTQMGSKHIPETDREKHIKKKVTRYMAKPRYGNKSLREEIALRNEIALRYYMYMEQYPAYIPDSMYQYTSRGKKLRSDVAGFGVPLKSQKKKSLKGGRPQLRCVPSHYLSRGEANRIVNIATKLLVATETVEDLQSRGSQSAGPDRRRRPQSAPKPFATYNTLPLIKEPRTGSLEEIPPRPKTARGRQILTYDFYGRKVPMYKSVEEGSDSAYTTERSSPRNDDWARSRSAEQQTKSDSPSDTASDSINMENIPRKPSLDKPSRQRRPKSAKYRHRSDTEGGNAGSFATAGENVMVERTAQTTMESVGIQTEKRLLDNYDFMEDIVKGAPDCEYQVYVRTGNKIGASTAADVKIILYGEKGRTEEVTLAESKRHKIKFQKGKEDLFILNAPHIGCLKKIKIGHDREELAYAWFLEGVAVYDMHDRRIYEFLCERWLSGQDADRRTYRHLSLDRDRALIDDSESDATSDISGIGMTKGSAYISEGLQGQKDADIDSRSDDFSIQVQPGIADDITQQIAQQESYIESESDASDSEADGEEKHIQVEVQDEVIATRESALNTSAQPATLNAENTIKLDESQRQDDFFDQSPAGPVFTFRSSGTDIGIESHAEGDADSLKPSHSKPSTASSEKSSSGSSSDDETSRLPAGIVEDVVKVEVSSPVEAAVKQNKEQPVGDQQNIKEVQHDDLEERWKVLRGPSVHMAAKSGDLSRIQALVQHYPELKSAPNEVGWNIMHIAASEGQLDVIKWMTATGVDMNAETPTGYKPIHLAAMNGNVDSMMVLAAMGAEINCETMDKQTPLHLAAQRDRLNCVRWLVANKARLDAMDDFGRTALMIADEYEHDSVANLLKDLEQAGTGRGAVRTSALMTIEEEARSAISRNTNDVRVQETDTRDKDSSDSEDSESYVESVSTSTSTSSSYESEDEKEDEYTEKDKGLEEKRQIYDDQRIYMTRTGTSFLDSIRQQVDEDV